MTMKAVRGVDKGRRGLRVREVEEGEREALSG
jgi:hypothetical protein